MNDHVSCGSQPQYRPHAASAQIAPAAIAKVQIGNAKACSRKASASSVSAAGSRRASEYGNLRLPFSYPARIKNRAAGTKPTSRVPDASTAAETWMTNQYEFSAGTSGLTST